MKAITESETKNDQKCAELIGRMSYSGFLPQAHISAVSIPAIYVVSCDLGIF